MELIAVLRDPKKYKREAFLIGFVNREIKKFTSLAPSYSGEGPYREREFTYVDLNDKKWPCPTWWFGDLEKDVQVQIRTVTLGPKDEDPADLYQLERYVRAF